MWVEGRKRGLARILWAALACSVAGWLPGAALGQSELDGSPRPLTYAVEPFDGAGYRPEVNGYAARWRHIARAMETDAHILARCRVEPGACPDAARSLLDIVETAHAKEGLARIGEINRAINLAIRYQSDSAHHGAPDVWASPLATLSSGRGDCEDFALAKYLALREAGISLADVRFVVVRDTRLEENHAVVTVRFDDRWLVLDNRRFVLLQDHEAANYAAVSIFGPDAETRLAAQPADGSATERDVPATGSAGEQENVVVRG
jgi:predicted transglutaminase-like cysteine proteinase